MTKALVAGGLAALSAGLPAAAAAAAGSSSTSSSLGSAQAQARALEGQIAAEQQQMDVLAEQYDQASVQLDQVQSALARTAAQLSAERAQEQSDRHQLQVDAVNAYIYDVPAQGLDQLFTSVNNSTVLDQEYQATAIGDVQHAVTDLQADQAQLATSEAALVGEQRQAAARASAVQADEQAASAAGARARATLAGVNGRIAELVAEQAAEQAAAAAAAAAAASGQAARHQAAEQASQAAQVAQTVESGSQTADQATNSANGAAGAAGGPPVIGPGQPEKASGAGAVALTRAEKYLGVPYQWGGASENGVDCSGLTMLAWEAAGVDLAHSAALQYEESTPVPLSEVVPGDLLFYDLEGTGISHVVMYVGSGPYGSQTIIQAAETGTVVGYYPYFTYGLVGAGRP
jgi:peptidoglycan DL-endopeptidase CwlO